MTAKKPTKFVRPHQSRDRRDAAEKAGFFRLETRARFKIKNGRS